MRETAIMLQEFHTRNASLVGTSSLAPEALANIAL